MTKHIKHSLTQYDFHSVTKVTKALLNGFTMTTNKNMVEKQNLFNEL